MKKFLLRAVDGVSAKYQINEREIRGVDKKFRKEITIAFMDVININIIFEGHDLKYETLQKDIERTMLEKL